MAQGNLEIPLNETGLAQARAAAPLLVDRGITTIISSPLSRARITAEIAAEQLGLPVLFDPDLHEVEFGEMEGKPMLAQWFKDWINGLYTPSGGESFLDLRKRSAGAVNRALMHQAPVLIVAHGALFRALRANLGLDPDVRLENAVPQFCDPPPSGRTSWTITPTVAQYSD